MLEKYWTFQDLILEFCDTYEIYSSWDIVIFFVFDRFTTHDSTKVSLKGYNRICDGLRSRCADEQHLYAEVYLRPSSTSMVEIFNENN